MMQRSSAVDGGWPIPDRPATGLAGDSAAVEKYRIR